MITKIELKNFKSHAHTVIEPGRVTALVGPNGAGKSSVLQALKKLIEFAVPSLSLDNRFLDPSDKLIREGSGSFKVKAEGQEQSASWSFELSSSSQEAQSTVAPSFKIPPWGIFIKGEISSNDSEIGFENGFLATPFDVQAPYREGHPIPNDVIAAIGKYSYLKASASNLAAPSYSEEIPPKISADGHGLASLFAYLLGNSRKIAEQIENSLKSIVPTIKQVGFTSAKITINETKLITFNETTTPISDPRQVTGQKLVFDTTSADGVPASEMSDGTLLALGLLTLLWSPSSPQLIMLDDIETGLHPLAQRQLMQVLKDFAEKHDRQIILTSHSPYIIDELDAKDIWVMATDKEGISHAKRLSEHPDAERALSVLTTGEFASAYDEEWVVDETESAELVNG